MKRYKIIPYLGKSTILKIHNDLMTDLMCIEPSLSFGETTVTIQIQRTPGVKNNEIHLSEELINHFRIPLYCDYEISFYQNTMVLGPYIGIIADLTKKGLIRRLSDLDSYVKYYEKIGGSIAAFSLDSVNVENERISEGFIYNPQIQEWICTKDIPLPSSLFNKCKVERNKQWEFLSSYYKANICNFPTFDKWEMYKWFSTDPTLKEFLPKTLLCKTPKDILQFLRRYKNAYLKPIGGTFAKGIVGLSYSNQGVKIKYEVKRKTITQTYYQKREFISFLKRLLRKNEYLIQESLNLISANQRVVDFRFIYFKNQEREWENGGLFARFGKQGSSVSNLTSGGKPQLGEKALIELLQSEELADHLYEKMLLISEKAANKLEQHLITCGNLGFDFGIDENHKLWIIEINNEDPDHRIATVCKRKDLMYYARLQNMLYTKALANFHEKTPPNL
ncbi:YheC/YheD family protein [Metabacillus litoralis]|uniref:YheC/YheD family endospore coat-associated protein n=1 Tax=Metabacillus litoralis TaxID=152268 RepID=UPI001CFF4E1D|nr:YheC/YheD family protein [Metabacillus litoralis]